jgi:hypothetical protein
MVVIIGSLCFSVGEGLRLTPFSVSPVSQVEETNNLTGANEASGPVLAKYGPLAVPAPVQKRSRRQTTQFAVPPVTTGSQVVTFTWNHSAD